MEIIKTELTEVRNAFATPRRTEILDWDADVDDEDLIAREDMVVTVSHAGYIKRVPLSTYRAQRRGGKGRAGMTTRDEDCDASVRRQHHRRCCSSPRSGRPTRRRSGACRSRRRTPAARRS